MYNTYSLVLIFYFISGVAYPTDPAVILPPGHLTWGLASINDRARMRKIPRASLILNIIGRSGYIYEILFIFLYYYYLLPSP